MYISVRDVKKTKHYHLNGLRGLSNAGLCLDYQSQITGNYENKGNITRGWIVSAYFTELWQILDKYPVLPTKWYCTIYFWGGLMYLYYSIDEKGIQTCHKHPPVVAARRNVTNSITSRKSSTVMWYCLETQIPSCFGSPGKRIPTELLDGCSEGTAGDLSDSR